MLLLLDDSWSGPYLWEKLGGWEGRGIGRALENKKKCAYHIQKQRYAEDKAQYVLSAANALQTILNSKPVEDNIVIV